MLCRTTDIKKTVRVQVTPKYGKDLTQATSLPYLMTQMEQDVTIVWLSKNNNRNEDF